MEEILMTTRLDPRRYASGSYLRERLDAERAAGELVSEFLWRVVRGDLGAALELGQALRAHLEAVDRLDGARSVFALVTSSEGPLARGRSLTGSECYDLEVALERGGMG